MKRFRISLLGLLLITTAVGMFFGYSQWRRHKILREIESLQGAGAMIVFMDSWQNKLWAQVPKKGAVWDSTPNYQSLIDRMTQLGVEEVELWSYPGESHPN